jgi:hypothetical protein
MDSLLSGFIGALIATVLSVIYMYISEKYRLRSDCMLEVVGYFDDIYTLLQRLHVDKDASYTGKKRGLTDEEYRTSSKTLKDLLITTRVGVKLAIVYGEGDLSGMFNYLQENCLAATIILWGAAESDWTEKNKDIHKLFSERIDPLRKSMERKLIDGTKANIIIKDLLLLFNTPQSLLWGFLPPLWKRGARGDFKLIKFT